MCVCVYASVYVCVYVFYVHMLVLSVCDVVVSGTCVCVLCMHVVHLSMHIMRVCYVSMLCK